MDLPPFALRLSPRGARDFYPRAPDLSPADRAPPRQNALGATRRRARPRAATAAGPRRGIRIRPSYTWAATARRVGFHSSPSRTNADAIVGPLGARRAVPARAATPTPCSRSPTRRAFPSTAARSGRQRRVRRRHPLPATALRLTLPVTRRTPAPLRRFVGTPTALRRHPYSASPALPHSDSRTATRHRRRSNPEAPPPAHHVARIATAHRPHPHATLREPHARHAEAHLVSHCLPRCARRRATPDVTWGHPAPLGPHPARTGPTLRTPTARGEWLPFRAPPSACTFSVAPRCTAALRLPSECDDERTPAAVSRATRARPGEVGHHAAPIGTAAPLALHRAVA